MSKDKSAPQDAENFMLSEYSLLKDFRASVLRQMDSRLNIYFASVSGVVAALALLNQILKLSIAFYLASLVLLLLLAMLGITTFNRIVQGHISVTRYTRGINLARRYFVSLHKTVGQYISQPIVDSEPLFGSMGFISENKSPKINRIGLTAMSIPLNSLVVALLSVFIVQFSGQISIAISVLFGVFVFVASFVLHEVYLKDAMKKAEENYLRDQEKLKESVKNL